jgi:UDP-GlcNAc:undecaprenyl-phosphate GlcNAc-1-phosphate transferase
MFILIGVLFALSTTSLLILLLSSHAHHIGLVDTACSRKIHQNDIPTIGGIAIFSGFLLALFFVHGSDMYIYLFGFVLPALLLVGVGAIDDVIYIPFRRRFAAQVVAGLLMTLAGGVVIDQLGELLLSGNVINLGVFAVPFTIIFLVGLVNAFNLCDGIDGLAGSLALVALLGLGAVALIGGQFHTLTELSLLGVCLLAFLAFNARFPGHHRASVYLGDSGSTFLGFALLWFSIILSQGEQAVMSPVTPLWFFALPLFDMTTVFIRRIVNKQHPFSADREHLHHMLLTAGFSVGHAVLIIAAGALLLAGIGIAGLYLGVHEGVMLVLFFGFLAFYYFVVSQCWESRRFFGRVICRRSGKDRRRGGHQHQGICLRRGEERRTDLAFSLSAHGKRVSAITPRPLDEDPLEKLPPSAAQEAGVEPTQRSERIGNM